MVEGAWNPAGKSCAAGGGLLLSAAGVRIAGSAGPWASHPGCAGRHRLVGSVGGRQAVTSIGSSLVRVGEASGQLAEMLQSLATLYGEAGQARMKRPWY